MNAIQLVKKDGMELNKIPNRERTDELCSIAVHQNPKALQYVPVKKQSVILCKYALDKDPSTFRYIRQGALTGELCIYALKKDGMLLKFIPQKYLNDKAYKVAVSNNIRALSLYTGLDKNEVFHKCSDRMVKKCLEWIKESVSASVFLPDCVKADRRVLDYQKELHCLYPIAKYYKSTTERFYIRFLFSYQDHEKGSVKNKYEITLEYASFDDFYNILDGNLEGAELRQYSFSNIDLHAYNIQGAVIHSDVLNLQGLYDDSYFRTLQLSCERIVDPISDQELPLAENHYYLRAVEDEGYSSFDFKKIPFYYISDIHIAHQILNYFKKRATQEEVECYIKWMVRDIVKSIGTRPYNSFLIIAGDTSSVFEFTKVFFTELVRLWRRDRIIVILGNHELLDPAVEMEKNIAKYKEFFAKMGVFFLQNEVLGIPDDVLTPEYIPKEYKMKPFILSEEQVLEKQTKDLLNDFLFCPVVVFGGIGFSGLNEEYNATNLRYGRSFDSVSHEEARKREKSESQRFDLIYKKLLQSIPNSRVIVVSHMKKDDWSEDVYNPNWIYVSGHNHRNFLELSDQRKIYADNQIGYKSQSLGLKYFFADSDYDIFSNLEDGIYPISAEQYYGFNRGKRIECTYRKSDKGLLLLKRKGICMFVFRGRYGASSKQERLYLLNGGKMIKLSDDVSENALEYYYNNMCKYAENVNRLMDKYSGWQSKIAEFIKSIGGWGRIHGCIIDIENPTGSDGFSYNHLFVNPINGTVTPYFAYDISSRVIYKDLKALLENDSSCARLLKNYMKKLETDSAHLPALRYSTEITEWGEDDAVYSQGGYLYKMSRIIKSLQYCSEKNVIRVWNEKLLSRVFVDNIMLAKSEKDVLDDNLIIELP